jgi:hypothetical protein
MLKPAISNFGVKGIRKAAKRILKWPDIMASDDIRRTCLNTYFFIDHQGGTGGGIFRYMYGRFIKEVSGITGEASFIKIGDKLHEIGDSWQEIATLFNRAFECSDPASMLPEISDSMLDIADEELKVWEELISLVG